MNAWLLILCLLLLESVVLLLAAAIWHDRLRTMLARWVRPGQSEEGNPAHYAGRLAEAHRHLHWLKDKTAAGGAPNVNLEPFDQGIAGLRQAAETLSERPEAMASLSQGLLTTCELLTHLLELQIAAAQPTVAIPSAHDSPAEGSAAGRADPSQAATEAIPVETARGDMDATDTTEVASPAPDEKIPIQTPS